MSPCPWKEGIEQQWRSDGASQVSEDEALSVLAILKLPRRPRNGVDAVLRIPRRMLPESVCTPTSTHAPGCWLMALLDLSSTSPSSGGFAGWREGFEQVASASETGMCLAETIRGLCGLCRSVTAFVETSSLTNVSCGEREERLALSPSMTDPST